ncbi:MAG: efflux RND transporter periplasmic adaptor subunit [Bacteroidales bacterium]|nr:efflux RND transporter periplasmic adaptor subunit [Clostridium sp.]MCM1204320.1 efflux RND transporter periplasmic adaptor subunit [Bacteroidales bacterium]
MKSRETENGAAEEIKAAPAKKKKSKKGIVITIIVAAVLLLVVLAVRMLGAISQGMEEAMQGMAGQSEKVFQVERQDVEQEIITSGIVIGMEKDAYTSPVTAKVEDIKVEVGQTVKKGDILLTYDASRLGDDLTKVKIQAQSERAAGNESYEAVNEAAGKAGKAREKANALRAEIEALTAEINALSAEIAGYEERINAAEALPPTEQNAENGDNSDTDNKENASAKKKDTSAKPLTKKEEAAYAQAKAALQEKSELLAQKQAELAEQEAIIEANEGVKVSESTKAQISASNQLSDMNISDAQKSLDAAEAGITAERSGIVESIDVIKGAYANETQTLMTIIDINKIGVEFSIAKDDLGAIKTGQKARVVVGDKEYEGTVDYVSRVAVSDMTITGNTDSGGTIKGRISLDKPDDIYIGVSAKVYIFVGRSENALAVPYEAVNSDVDGDYVYIINKENLIERKDITIGICSDEYYEITEGINEGDKVITEVDKNMKPGDEYIDGMEGTLE